MIVIEVKVCYLEMGNVAGGFVELVEGGNHESVVICEGADVTRTYKSNMINKIRSRRKK